MCCRGFNVTSVEDIIRSVEDRDQQIVKDIAADITWYWHQQAYQSPGWIQQLLKKGTSLRQTKVSSVATPTALPLRRRPSLCSGCSISVWTAVSLSRMFSHITDGIVSVLTPVSLSGRPSRFSDACCSDGIISVPRALSL